MKKNLLVLVALVVAITAWGVDPSHARRIRLSLPAAKAAPVAAAKPAPVAAAARKESAKGNLVVMPGVAIRPANGAAPAGAPAAFSGPFANAEAFGLSMPAATTETSDQGKVSPASAASKIQEPAPAPARTHFVDLNPAPPTTHREIGPPPPPRMNATLCFKTAAGTCGSL